MPLYQLTLFYKNLAENAATVRRIRSEIESISGKNWRVLQAGEQVCAIVFQTELEHKSLASRFASFGSEHFLFLLVEMSAAVQGWLGEGAWQWISTRLPRS
jgi:hypothetical protein